MEKLKEKKVKVFTEQARLKSPVFWSALLAQILGILVGLGVIGTELSEPLRMTITGILEILVLFGVLNNPTNKTGF